MMKCSPQLRALTAGKHSSYWEQIRARKMGENGSTLHSVQHEQCLPEVFFWCCYYAGGIFKIRQHCYKLYKQEKLFFIQFNNGRNHVFRMLNNMCVIQAIFFNMLACSCEFWDFLCRFKLFKSSAQFSFSAYSL